MEFSASYFDFVSDFEIRFSDFKGMVGPRRCRSLTHPTKDAMYSTRAGLNNISSSVTDTAWDEEGNISDIGRDPCHKNTSNVSCDTRKKGDTRGVREELPGT